MSAAPCCSWWKRKIECFLFAMIFFHLCTKEEKRRKSELLFWVLANQRWMVDHFSNSWRLSIGKPFCLFQNISQHSYLFFLLCPFKKKTEVELGIWFPIPFLYAHLMCKCATWGGLWFVPCFKERKAWIVHKHLPHLLRFTLHFLSTLGV